MACNLGPWSDGKGTTLYLMIRQHLPQVEISVCQQGSNSLHFNLELIAILTRAEKAYLKKKTISYYQHIFYRSCSKDKQM